MLTRKYSYINRDGEKTEMVPSGGIIAYVSTEASIGGGIIGDPFAPFKTIALAHAALATLNDSSTKNVIFLSPEEHVLTGNFINTVPDLLIIGTGSTINIGSFIFSSTGSVTDLVGLKFKGTGSITYNGVAKVSSFFDVFVEDTITSLTIDDNQTVHAYGLKYDGQVNVENGSFLSLVGIVDEVNANQGSKFQIQLLDDISNFNAHHLSEGVVIGLNVGTLLFDGDFDVQATFKNVTSLTSNIGIGTGISKLNLKASLITGNITGTSTGTHKIEAERTNGNFDLLGKNILNISEAHGIIESKPGVTIRFDGQVESTGQLKDSGGTIHGTIVNNGGTIDSFVSGTLRDASTGQVSVRDDNLAFTNTENLTLIVDSPAPSRQKFGGSVVQAFDPGEQSVVDNHIINKSYVPGRQLRMKIKYTSTSTSLPNPSIDFTVNSTAPGIDPVSTPGATASSVNSLPKPSVADSLLEYFINISTTSGLIGARAIAPGHSHEYTIKRSASDTHPGTLKIIEIVEVG